MKIQEIDELIEDTKRLPRVPDKVALNSALAQMEIARQLMILNESLAAGGAPKSKTAGAGKKR